jgi:hypothetical protein
MRNQIMKIPTLLILGGAAFLAGCTEGPPPGSYPGFSAGTPYDTGPQPTAQVTTMRNYGYAGAPYQPPVETVTTTTYQQPAPPPLIYPYSLPPNANH